MHADTLDLMLQRELPAAARGDQRAYGRIVQACQNAVTGIALAIHHPRRGRQRGHRPGSLPARLAATGPAAEREQLPALAAPDHPQPGP